MAKSKVTILYKENSVTMPLMEEMVIPSDWSKMQSEGGVNVTGNDIKDDTITNENIEGQTITAAEIANATITGSQIANATITGTNIDSATIEAGNIAAGTITATEIANATITATQIANATITATNIANATITSTQISGSANITGNQIANATITGSNIGSTTIEAGNIANATITSTQIAASAGITGGQIANATITSSQIATNAGIVGGQIDNLTITAGNIANLTITTSQIANSTIVGGDIAQNTISGGASGNIALTSITADNIAATTITATQIAANTITANELTTGSFVTATANIADAIITNAKITDLNVDKLVTGTMTSQAITLGVNIGGSDAKIQAGKTDFGDTTRGFILGIDDVHATLGDATSQWDVTNPTGTTFRYTWDGTGTDPDVESNVKVDDIIQIAGFNVNNNGNFTVTAVGTNYFEITNASGVVESDITNTTLEVGGRVKFEIDEGTITGGIIQTGIAGSGERIKIYEDTVMGFDSANIMRVASDNGKWMFWDEDAVASGGIYGIASAGLFIASFDMLSLFANDGTSVVNVRGGIEPDVDGTYDIGSRLYKWDYEYMDKGIRFDYAQVNWISKIDDSDGTYMRIRFDANSGSIGFGRPIYPISDDLYDLGVSTSNRWRSIYLTSNVHFETTESKGLIWDASGDNAQFFYDNTDDEFVINKTLSLNNNKIIGVIDPTSSQDAATKYYVDNNFAKAALSNLASVAINTALLPASAGSISLGSSTKYWNTLRLGSNIFFYGTDSKGLIWDYSGDNAQIYYDNSNNRFVITKKLNLDGQQINNLAEPTSSSDAATRNYVDNNSGSFACSDLGSCNMTSLGTYNHNDLQNRSANDHHNAYSNGYAITPYSYTGGAIICNSGSIDQTDAAGRIRQKLAGLVARTEPGTPSSDECYIYFDSGTSKLYAKIGTVLYTLAG